MTIIKVLVYAILRRLDRLIQRLVPPKPRRICYMSLPDYSDNAYHMFRHCLLTRDNIEHIWLIKNTELIQQIQQDLQNFNAQSDKRGSSIRILSKRTFRGYWYYLTSHIIFHTHGGYPFTDRAYRRHNVNLWHGMPIKCIAQLNTVTPNPFPTYGSVHIATSQFFKYVIACAFDSDPDTVLVSNLPRCDALLPNALPANRRNEIFSTLELPEEKPFLLWMPTYRVDGFEQIAGQSGLRSFLDDLPENTLETLNTLAAEHGCVICIKLHVMDPLNHTEHPKQYEHIRFITASQWLASGIPLYDLVAASQALLSDISSIVIDYLVTGRPIGLVGFNPETYARDLIFSPELLYRSQRYHVIDNVTTMQAFFRDVIKQQPQTVAPDNDLAQMFYEPFDEPGAELILKRLGYDAASTRDLT